VQIELQPFDGTAMDALKQQHPVRGRARRMLRPPAVTRPGEQGLVVVDYTHPSAVHANAKARSVWRPATPGGAHAAAPAPRARQFYAQHSVPFVMGTTGGDRAQLVRCRALRCHRLQALTHRAGGGGAGGWRVRGHRAADGQAAGRVPGTALCSALCSKAPQPADAPARRQRSR
jgi:hypothetical protein